MPIVDIGKALQGYGLRVGQHKAFGPVGKHAENSYHYHDEAIDVTDHRADEGPEYEGGPSLHWQERTKRLMQRARELGTFDEVLGPGDAGHGTHVHLAKRKDRPGLNAQQLEYLGTGRWKQPDGSYAMALPNPGNATPAPGAAPTTATQESSPPLAAAAADWRAAAGDPGRSRDPMSAAYWEREDMKQWAAANPKLAAPMLAAAGVNAPLASLPPPTPPAASLPDGSFKPVSRGALGGVQVGPLPQVDPEMAKAGTLSWQRAYGVSLPQVRDAQVRHWSA
jgi:hypothetical protein